jgi:hypothetical protein
MMSEHRHRSHVTSQEAEFHADTAEHGGEVGFGALQAPTMQPAGEHGGPSASDLAFGEAKPHDEAHAPAVKHHEGLTMMEVNSEYVDKSQVGHDSNPMVAKRHGSGYTPVHRTASIIKKQKPDIVMFEEIDRWYAHHGNHPGSHKGLIEELKDSYKVVFPPGTRAGVMVRTEGHHVHMYNPKTVDDPGHGSTEPFVFVHVVIDGTLYLLGAGHFRRHTAHNTKHERDVLHRREANAVMNHIDHDRKSHKRNEEVIFGADFNEHGGYDDRKQDDPGYRVMEKRAAHVFGKNKQDANNWRNPAGQRSEVEDGHTKNGVLGVFSTIPLENQPDRADHTGPAGKEEHMTQVVTGEVPHHHHHHKKHDDT